jgi:hypothetical protein
MKTNEEIKIINNFWSNLTCSGRIKSFDVDNVHELSERIIPEK